MLPGLTRDNGDVQFAGAKSSHQLSPRPLSYLHVDFRK